MYYSIIVPVYNRPDEVQELLASLTEQHVKNFEVIIVEDGSTETSENIVTSFKDQLDIHYYYQQNSGPGLARNTGFQHAHGDYFIVLDSDCIIPSSYLENVDTYLSKTYVDAFGGPDRAHDTFTPVQKAINYAMTSALTTGGIRGRKKHIGRFHPRSFNMGISKDVYKTTQGFSTMRYGEDIEFSIRIINAGYKTGLISDAFVYHKRRTNFSNFFRQTSHFGSARIDLNMIYPGELRLVHCFPAIFTLYCLLTLVMIFIHLKWFYVMISLLAIYMFAIFLGSTFENKSLKIGFLSINAALVQLFGYGTGFICAYWKRVILKK